MKTGQPHARIAARIFEPPASRERVPPLARGPGSGDAASNRARRHGGHFARAALNLAILLSIGASCGGRARLWESALKVSGPHEVGSFAAWVDSTRGRVFSVDPARKGALAVEQIAVPGNIMVAVAPPSQKRLLLLSAGKEARYSGQQREAPALTVVQPGVGGELEARGSYPLSAAFDRLAVSSDARHAAAFFTSGPSASSAQEVFRNPNEIALIDLSLPASQSNPTLRTLRSFGSAPAGVIFSPPLTLGGVTRVLAVILADNYLTLVDMTHPGRKEITTPLVKPGSASVATPRDVLFSTSTNTIFVRTDSVTDLFALKLGSRKPAATGDNDFTIVINQPSAGKKVRDMIVYGEGGKDLLLTVNESQDLELIDAGTGQFSTITVGEPVDTILAVPAGKPTLALLYSQSKPRARIHVLTLKDLGKKLEQNLVSRSLARPVKQLVATGDHRQALVIHDDKRTVISVLDLVGPHHTISPIAGQLPLGSFDFASGSHLVGVSSGLRRLGVLDLSSLLASNLRLDHDPRKVLVVGGAIVVDHGMPQGLITVVPGPLAGREACRVYDGFLLQGIMDRELED